MKLLKIRLKNLNSFKSEVDLNFEGNPLNDASLLAITGPTGSGKTTLLDALCVALYNKTPRLGGKGSRSAVNLLRQGASEGFSEVLFEANGNRYLSEWTVKRNKKGSLTPSAKLIYADTEKLITGRLTPRRNAEALEDMSVEGAVSKILGLDFSAFNRSVMLAQGEFAAFLKAEPEKKREILEATTGMDLYEQLKDALNEKMKDVEAAYNQSESELNVVPFVSQEEIDSTQELLTKLSRELEQLSAEKEKISQAKDLETKRVQTHEQLLIAENEQKKLFAQKKEIEILENEIASARRAANIRAELDAFESEKSNLNRADRTVKTVQKTLKTSQGEYEQSKILFENADRDLQKAREESKEKMAILDAAREEEIQSEVQLDQAKGRLKEIEEAEETIAELENFLKARSDEKTLLEGQIEKDEKFLRENPLPDNSERLFAEASATISTLKGMERTSQEKSKAHTNRLSARNKLQENLQSLKKERQALQDVQTKSEESLRQAEDKLNSLLERGNEEDWQRRKDDAQQLQDVANSYENANRALHELQTQARENRETLETVEKALDDIEKTLAVQSKELERTEESIKRYEAEERYALISNQIVVLRKEHLTNGSPCPVCGAIEHPWSEKEELEQEKLIQEASANLANARNELKKLQQESRRLEQQKTRQETSKSKLQQDLQKAQNDIVRLKTEIENAKAQWSEVYPDEEISSKLVSFKIRQADAYLREINTAKIDKTDAQNNLNLLNQKLQSNRRDISSAENQLNDIEQEIQTLSGEIGQLTQEIAQAKVQFWELLPEEFRAHPRGREEAPEAELRKFERRISAVKQCHERLGKNRQILQGLTTSIEENEKKLTGEKARLEHLRFQANQYQRRANELWDSARTKTGGLKADVARRNLHMELENKEKERNDLLENLQRDENRLTESKTSLTEANERLEESRKRFSEVEVKYTQVLQQANFASPEEHREAFRNSEWIEENSLLVEKYRRDVHAVEQQVENLQRTFASNPFDSEELSRIQKEEREVESSIAEKREQRGKCAQEINQFQQYLKIREQRAANLEKVQKERDRWVNLRSCMPANELRDFALKSMFDLMVQFANKQLDDLTHRYELKVKDMREMLVIDRWNAGEERPVETLSGGESFLTSLSLALALSELSKGRTQLDSLFLDEGFGTLDSETLDIALSALESLQLSGTNIVVISHIGELTRRIPVRIAVKRMGDGSSRIDVEGS
ncbi:AAA family ATPase [bacterium]|nr:AAA family ATPase [bacterium]